MTQAIERSETPTSPFKFENEPAILYLLPALANSSHERTHAEISEPPVHGRKLHELQDLYVPGRASLVHTDGLRQQVPKEGLLSEYWMVPKMLEVDKPYEINLAQILHPLVEIGQRAEFISLISWPEENITVKVDSQNPEIVRVTVGQALESSFFLRIGLGSYEIRGYEHQRIVTVEIPFKTKGIELK